MRHHHRSHQNLSALIRALEEIGSGAGADVSFSLDTGVSGGLDVF